MDAFEILGLPPRFDLDEKVLAARQKELSLALHPDRFGGRPAAERRAALGKAIEVNEAYRALREPISRAETLLRKWGIPQAERDAGGVAAELLMDMMEQREMLREAASKKDVASIERLTRQIRARQRAEIEELTRALSELQQRAGQEPEEALRRVATLRYFRRFLDESEALLDELF
jgi:molecular chaperone HscB